MLDGKVLAADEVRRLATLESREVLLARLAGLLQASAQQTVSLLAAPLRQVADLRGKRIGVPGMGTPPFVFANRDVVEVGEATRSSDA